MDPKRIQVFDLKNISMSILPALNLFKQSLGLLDLLCPETLECIYVINAPAIFSILFKLVKPMVPKATLKRIRVCGDDFHDVSLW